MGLYLRALEISLRGKGLLSHAEAIRATPRGVSAAGTARDPDEPEYPVPLEKAFTLFHRFAEETGIERMAILLRIHDVYLICYSHGFDTETVSLFSVPAGTMEQKVKNGEWTVLNIRSCSPFSACFSEREYQNLNRLYLRLYTLDSGIDACVVFADSQLNISVKQKIDPSAADIVIPALFALISDMTRLATQLLQPQPSREKLLLHIESSVESGMTGTLFQIIPDQLVSHASPLLTLNDKEILLKSAAFLIAKFFGIANILYRADTGILFGIVFSFREIATGLFREELEKSLLPYFQGSSEGDLVVNGLGSTREVPEMAEFLFGVE